MSNTTVLKATKLGTVVNYHGLINKVTSIFDHMVLQGHGKN